MILDAEQSSMLGISSERELPSSSFSKIGNGECRGGMSSQQSGKLIKLPFRVDVAEGEQEINIVEWRAGGSNKTKKWIPSSTDNFVRILVQKF